MASYTVTHYEAQKTLSPNPTTSGEDCDAEDCSQPTFELQLSITAELWRGMESVVDDRLAAVCWCAWPPAPETSSDPWSTLGSSTSGCSLSSSETRERAVICFSDMAVLSSPVLSSPGGSNSNCSWLLIQFHETFLSAYWASWKISFWSSSLMRSFC